MSITIDKHKFSKDEILRTINTVLLSIIGIMITIGTVWMRNMEVDRKADIREINNKMDGLMIATLTNSNAIQSHEINASIWKDRITALEEGTTVATADRITKTEALAAVSNLRKWVEKYYERK